MQQLKNVSIVHMPNGDCRLYDDSGLPVDSFNRYCSALNRKYSSKATRSTYSSAVAHFIDYLFEAGIFRDDNQPSEKTVSNTINLYVEFLLRGKSSGDPLVRHLATTLNREPLQQIGPAVAAINLYLQLAVDWAAQDKELMGVLGDSSAHPDKTFLSALSVPGVISSIEAGRMRQNSILGGNLRKIDVKKGTHKVGVKAPRSTKGAALNLKDFPIAHISPLIQHTENPRDKCFYSLLAASGLRESEALSLPIDLIDPMKRTLRIEDPNGFRGSQQYLPNERMPFKGRSTAKVYLLPHLKDLFFEALHEYLAVRPVTLHQFLFVKMTKSEWGSPFFETTNKDRNDAFRSAQKRIRLETKYTLHSFRHFYGVFLKNYLVIPGASTPGLPVEDVQILMGHECLSSTLKYAKTKQEILLAQLELSDGLLSGQYSYNDLPSVIANKYRELASAIESTPAARIGTHIND